ncbi:MAG: hypothetical protein B5766_03770 [Candidatus Lumbricidophila eiseniae]|uniref:Probable cytosol aminopeptidase n=1 Tax=Candidatus Lumbricidiphila eiseniae TaxID=1969409 RepID=A0A2A6FT92_9MICO|nr:MAG: hypothetical protein B5766_03770 [Candidatus Lumbricidophila eiseniae]
MDKPIRVTIVGVWQESLDSFPSDAWFVDGFGARIGETRVEAGTDGSILYVGLGSAMEPSLGAIRRAGMAAGRKLVESLPRVIRADSLVKPVVATSSFHTEQLPTPTVLSAVAEGLSYGGYRFRLLPDLEQSSLTPTYTVDDRVTGHDLTAWNTGLLVGSAVNTARSLVNMPPSLLTPEAFAQRMISLVTGSAIQVRVRDEDELTAEGFGGILAVGRGSHYAPKLLELRYGNGNPDLAMVGKGVTFDSGGLSLKQPDALMTMKSDMSGAAAVCAAFSILPTVAPDRSFVGIIPLVENMPGARAIRPGDVVELRSGHTIEILNTDFEGRVILADALTRAAEFFPRAILDMASLTYAATHALGDNLAALVTNDDAFSSLIEAAAAASGDGVWRMPLQPDLAFQIASDIADFSNFPGSRSARVSSAALLLSQFVPAGTQWGHVDMCGPSWRDHVSRWGTSGGTGYGVRLIIELAQRLGQPPAVP